MSTVFLPFFEKMIWYNITVHSHSLTNINLHLMLKQKLWPMAAKLTLLVLVMCCNLNGWAQTISSNTTWNPGNPPSTGVHYTVNNNATLTINGGLTATLGSITVTGSAKLVIENGVTLTSPLILSNDQTNIIDGSTINSSILMGDLHSTLKLTNGSTLKSGEIKIRQTNLLWLEDNSTIEMATGTSIILLPQESTTPGILQGGRLWVYDSKITNQTANELWGGISVIGGNGRASSYVYRSQYSGSTGSAVFVRSTVENSEWGVSNWNRNGGFTLWGTTWANDAAGVNSGGGIIQAINSTFKNNGTGGTGALYYGFNAVNFADYSITGPIPQNSPATSYADEKSYFRGCKFIVEDVSNRIFNRFMELKGVFGVKIEGCEFYDDDGVLQNAAITAFNSSFAVDSWCHCPSNACFQSPLLTCMGGTLKTTLFRGMRRGIVVANAGGIYPVLIQSAQMEKIGECGIAMSMTEGSKIRYNSIELEDRNIAGVDEIKGIALGGCSMYTIEGNKIAHPGSFSEKTIGILVNASGAYDNKVYMNALGNSATQNGPLRYGLRSVGNNVSTAIPQWA
jgi:hypothetical protein